MRPRRGLAGHAHAEAKDGQEAHEQGEGRELDRQPDRGQLLSELGRRPVLAGLRATAGTAQEEHDDVKRAEAEERGPSGRQPPRRGGRASSREDAQSDNPPRGQHQALLDAQVLLQPVEREVRLGEEEARAREQDDLLRHERADDERLEVVGDTSCEAGREGCARGRREGPLVRAALNEERAREAGRARTEEPDDEGQHASPTVPNEVCKGAQRRPSALPICGGSRHRLAESPTGDARTQHRRPRQRNRTVDTIAGALPGMYPPLRIMEEQAHQRPVWEG